jgi:two-component sensor histidine kinase/PAS domain-containing protein
VAGWKAALIAAGLGLAAAWYYFVTPGSWVIGWWDAAFLAVYVVTCLLIIFVVTNLNHALIEVARQRNRLKAAMEIAKLGLWHWTPPDKFEWDATARHMFDLRPDDPLPSAEQFLAWTHPADRSHVEKLVEQAIKGELSPDQEYRIITPDGWTKWMHFYAPKSLQEGTTTIGIGQDVTERRAHEEQVTLLLHELAHRVKNQYMVILAMARELGKRPTTVQEFQHEFTTRLMALSAAHDLLLESKWQGASMATLVAKQLAHLPSQDRITLSGPEVKLTPTAVQTMAMAFLELGTNAVKHGALGGQDGKVSVSWSLVPDQNSRPGVKFVWREFVEMGRQRPDGSMGFGRRVLEQLTATAMQGRTRLAFHDDGVEWLLEAPSSCLIHEDSSDRDVRFVPED